MKKTNMDFYNEKLKKIDKNYHQYMNIELLDNILSEFEWGENYILESDLPDGIIVEFPNSKFYFSESYMNHGSIEVSILEVDPSLLNMPLTIYHAINLLKDRMKKQPELFRNMSVRNSLSKVTTNLRNKCILIHYYLKPYILGDKSWVEEYKKKTARDPMS